MNGDGVGPPTEDERNRGARRGWVDRGPDADWLARGLLGAALSLVVLARLVPLPSVYRRGDVVLPGNDPYYYRTLADRVLADVAGPLDVATLLTHDAVTSHGEPLLVAGLAWLASLLGGPDALAHLMAWYPVLAGLATAVAVYAITMLVADDRRAGLAAVALLAITPGHAVRTSLGFADHHAFDYGWLALTALVLVALVGEWSARRRTTVADEEDGGRDPARFPRAWQPWVLAALLALGVAGQTLAWEGSPVLLVPVGIAVVGALWRRLHLAGSSEGDSPTPAANDEAGSSLGGVVDLGRWTPVLAGLAGGAGTVVLVHVALGWQTTAVALGPVAVAAGAVGAVALAVGVARSTGDHRHFLAGVAGLGVLGVAALALFAPAALGRLGERVASILATRAPVETHSMFDPRTFGVLLQFGFLLAVAVPAMALAARRALGDDRWLVALAYGAWTLLLATFSIRFAGQLALFGAVFGGIGLVWLADWVDLGAPLADDGDALAVPGGGRLRALVVLALLVSSAGLVQTPVRISTLQVSEDVHATGAFLEQVEGPAASDDAYVLSHRNTNRFYNYRLDGDGRSYQYAIQGFPTFMTQRSPDRWAQSHDHRVDYVVVPTPGSSFGPRTAATRLGANDGSRVGTTPGLGRFRALHRAPGGSLQTYALVPGAVLSGTASANATVSVRTDVSVPNAAFTYRRQVRAAPNGSYSIRVPYAGAYRLRGAGANGTVAVPADAVESGATVAA